MDFWEVLGIAPSENVKFIKKAYRLQKMALEANQAGFAEKAKLESAFQQALNHADPGRFTQTKAADKPAETGATQILETITRQLGAPQPPKTQRSPRTQQQPRRRNEGVRQHRISPPAAKPRKKTTAPPPATAAMPAKNRQRVRQGNEHKQNNVAKKLLRLLGLLLILVILGGTVFRVQLEHFWYTSPVADQLRETIGKKDYDALSNLKEGTEVEQFMYYFYGKPDDSDKETFINESMTGEAAKQARQYLGERPSEFVVKKAYDFEWEIDDVADGRQIHAVSREGQPLLMIDMDKNYRIAHVYGTGWTLLPKVEFDDLYLDVRVTPYDSSSHFGSYLVAEDPADFIEKYGHYFSEAAKKQMRENQTDLRESFLDSGFFRSAYVDGELTGSIFYDTKKRPQFLVTFTPRGEIDQIVRPDGTWDTYSKKAWDAIADELSDSEFSIYELKDAENG